MAAYRKSGHGIMVGGVLPVLVPLAINVLIMVVRGGGITTL